MLKLHFIQYEVIVILLETTKFIFKYGLYSLFILVPAYEQLFRGVAVIRANCLPKVNCCNFRERETNSEKQGDQDGR